MIRWAPHATLGDLARPFEAALGAGQLDRARALLEGAPPSPGLLAARCSLALARGAGPDDLAAAADAAREALAAAGDRAGAVRVDAEVAAALASGRAGTARADALVVDDGEPLEAQASVHRAKGIAARAKADLGEALHELETALALADESHDPREVLRTKNALGATYATLGVAEVARALLSEARELAEVCGERQSAAIAHGQLAVLALDGGRPAQAELHLALQLEACRASGDVHGEARAQALFAEAHAMRGDPRGARDAAEAARATHRRQPTPFTRASAVLATLVEAEDARLAGDEARVAELLAAVAPDLALTDDAHRAVRAKAAFVSLIEPGVPLATRFETARRGLLASPRPVWVERALLTAAASAEGETRRSLLCRATHVMDRRAEAASRSLAVLRGADRELVRLRAGALGKSLLVAARLALWPLQPTRATAGRPRDAAGVLSSGASDDLVVIDGLAVSTDPTAVRARCDDVREVTVDIGLTSDGALAPRVDG